MKPDRYAIDPQKLLDTIQWLEVKVDEQAATIRRMSTEALRAGSNDLHQWEVIQKLTGERDRARDLAVRSGVFEYDFGPNYALTPEEFDLPDDKLGMDNRPSAYDMPVGSVVVAHRPESGTFSYIRVTAHCWARYNGGVPGTANVESGLIEGLFADGLVTEWRLP